MRLTTIAAAGVVALAVAVPAQGTASTSAPQKQAGEQVADRCLEAAPDPGSSEPVSICFTVFRPAAAADRADVPVIIHSHGWGGSRIRDAATVRPWLDAGYAVVSFDQRGFGESGGRAHVQNPDVEGDDIARLVDHVAEQDWVQLDAPGDPRMGAVGGSYGGGFQLLGAFHHLQTEGKPVFDALAPEITWHDLADSLGPRSAVRTTWAQILLAAGRDALPPAAQAAFQYSATTGLWADGSEPGEPDLAGFFSRNGPRWQVSQGRRLDIPVLFGQGATDSLFPLEQGFRNFEEALTRRARKRSLLIGYNGGHVLPSTLPPGAVTADSDPCSAALAGGSFAQLALRFMDEQLRGERTGLTGYGRYHLATSGGACTTVRDVRADAIRWVGSVATSQAAGAPVSVKVADGPLRLAGRAALLAKVRTRAAGSRAYVGLSLGTSPADARLVQNNVLPVVEERRVRGEWRRIPLPAVAVDVPRGQSLFLTASPVSDTFGGTVAERPGDVALSHVVAQLPTVRDR